MKSHIEIHPFGYFYPKNPQILIIGSFPCYINDNYGEWFYSGSGKNYFWNLLSDVYNLTTDNLLQKEALCQEFGIAITDIALKVERLKMNCSDSNLKILEYNIEAIKECISKGVQKILFTSKFVEKHFNNAIPDNTIPTSVLISPSPQANRYVASIQEYKDLKKSGIIENTYDYRLLKYREILNK
jgi:G:T/U-mismatch repair DNA glycosylase